MAIIGKVSTVAQIVCALVVSVPLMAQDHTQHAPGSPAAVATAGRPVKITDPASVVLIVNRDSNDIGFMDIATHKMIGSVFLGNNVNPHMAMMSHDGRFVVTGGTRANKAYIIDVEKTVNEKKVARRWRKNDVLVHTDDMILADCNTEAACEP